MTRMRLVHDKRVPLFSFEGRSPTISPSAWIAPTATIVGDVTVGAEASVWYGAVIRADFRPIIVRRGANVQDGSVLHGGQLWVQANPQIYRDLAKRHAAGAHLISE